MDLQALCWGNNGNGQTQVPSLWDPMEKWKVITAGDHFTCGIITSGRLICWGLGTEYATSVSSGKHMRYLDVASGYRRTLGIKEEDGKVLCWGNSGDTRRYRACALPAPPWEG